jgi:hypothetical protein
MDRKVPLSRRRLLELSTVGLVTALAGCGSDDQPPPRTPAETPTETGSPQRTASDGRVLDVRDFGATPDGGRDDTDAIQQALDDASNGDTVYLPAGTYHVSAPDPTKESATAIEIDRNEHPDDLTIAGDGEQSQIVLRGGHTNDHVLFRVRVRDGWTGLRFRNLKIDGNKRNQPATSGGLGLWFGNANDGHENDIRIENCWIVDSNQNCLAVRGPNGVTVDHCTVTGAGSDHGLAYYVRSDVDPQGEVRNSYFADCAKYGIDAAGGKLLVQNCVLENNGWGSKTTFDTVDVSYRRVRFSNNRNFGYQRNPVGGGSKRATVTFAKCIADGNGLAGFRLGEDTDYRVSTMVAIGNNTSGESLGNIEVRDNATVGAGEIRSFGAANGVGLYVNGSARGDVSTYQHFANPAGAFGGSIRNFAIETEILAVPSTATGTPDARTPTDTADIPGAELIRNELVNLAVPDASEVGAVSTVEDGS